MSQPMLAHNVFFALNDPSDAARNQLVQACHQYLSKHPGTVFYACGALAQELRREVNDLDFDVALHLVFASQAAHDAYQAAPLHNQFVAENKATWKKVRVFDSFVAQG